MQISLVFAIRDIVLVQEARKRFDKASLLYDQVHSTFLLFRNFVVTVNVILLHSRTTLCNVSHYCNGINFVCGKWCCLKIIYNRCITLKFSNKFPFIGSLFWMRSRIKIWDCEWNKGRKKKMIPHLTKLEKLYKV